MKLIAAKRRKRAKHDSVESCSYRAPIDTTEIPDDDTLFSNVHRDKSLDNRSTWRFATPYIP